ncbi:MAG: neutral/alkaline non-lysosomal ceramidase N-terminal domain-containing protein [Verrucomicrobia bacterium]|nr:neutral/alkaline non-lysosomal ceramidase N-terminal domain-containing protein [Verrucomicrobiota bacterium]MCG2679239.1 hypothetical protein [Kiritimatiellia bacterium]MBU4248633.1 neutral/alkaline non-lysosomal ceramidase N-terminal domain-containing protein [Verrucomicrobiota bacterium]MBU4290094.1 neutral/alkaline non-lysosomal ceramidase N-terminal domain-containing protein [Verrucomicrobiota bacterium]MBU4429792.1 neutral/alkaline non-lysosomal ceramidase N-terminal domain-containing p
MKAGFSRIEITPASPVRMDGMIRDHQSTGVHDPIFAKALVLSGGPQPVDGFAICSLDVCGLAAADCREIRVAVEKQTGIPCDRVIIAATHTHSGPATVGIFGNREDAYVRELIEKTVAVVCKAATVLVPAAVGCASGREETISHYRRLLADDGHVVMNWDPWPAERLVGPLGVNDPEVGVMKIVSDDAVAKPLGFLFNHAGHPNVMSGDNYLITPDYPGRAENLVERELGGTAVFVNGAQGTMDIDGMNDRDWSGVERAGSALADAVIDTARNIVPSSGARQRSGSRCYSIPARKISDAEKEWADSVLKQTGGALKPVADGVGDDYKAKLFLRLWNNRRQDIPLEQICLAVDNYAFLSFPGELFTEIGMRIKSESPFRRTYILGLANGYVGYVPTRKAIREGGYESETRELDDSAEEVVVEQSLALLRSVRGLS